jgi:hypothetical protein
MTNEQLRMQMLSGIITETEYKAKLQENKEKEYLNEHFVAGGIVGVGAINTIPPRAKADFEMAFEHFLNERYEVEEDESGFGGMDPKGHGNVKDDTSLSEDEEAYDFSRKMDKIEDYRNPKAKYRWKGESISKDELIDAVEKSDDYTLITYLSVSMADPDGDPNSLQNLLVKKEIDKRGLLKNN